MSGRTVPLAFAFLTVAGCARPAAPSQAALVQNAPRPDPQAALYESLHAAAFQIGQAMDQINEAIGHIRPLANAQSGSTKDSLNAIADAFDEIGRGLEKISDSPTLDDVRRDSAAAEAGRKARIKATNQATGEIDDVQSDIDELSKSSPPAQVQAELDQADKDGDDARTALTEAVRQLGGKPIEN